MAIMVVFDFMIDNFILTPETEYSSIFVFI